MEAFFGTWKLAKKVNIDEFMKAVGAKPSDDSNLTETVYKEGDYFVWKVKRGREGREIKFKLDKAFQDGLIEGRPCTSTISFKGKQVVQVKKWGTKEILITRDINANVMITTLSFAGVQGQRIYQKV
ncbi:fatty acid-binding protein, brain-like [Tachysurus vachellii]|uniref:fatty acid-binding protein, brain-like n=1 Tax=Tachysurus vachellii TaxID=175792 RepID=UPI00296B255E|nr:fatty acid-binding protein, brain-like [Tachysurus vachellii]